MTHTITKTNSYFARIGQTRSLAYEVSSIIRAPLVDVRAPSPIIRAIIRKADVLISHRRGYNRSVLASFHYRRTSELMRAASISSNLKTQNTDFFIACKESRVENNTNFYGCFYIGPFDDRLSQTLANDLRRTLLSELTGLAITSLTIEGVLHKFSSLPGMKESVIDLLCNIQNIVLKHIPISPNKTHLDNYGTRTKKTYIGFLNVSGPRVIKASDLKLPAGIQCVDPDQYIATLAEDGFLNAMFNINEGKNFIKQKEQKLDVLALKKRAVGTFNLPLGAQLQNKGSHQRVSTPQHIKRGKNKAATLACPKGTRAQLNLPRRGFTTDRSQLNAALSPRVVNGENLKQSLRSSLPKSQQEVHNPSKVKGLLMTTKGSNLIPLDAVFMPVTKVNLIIEENNLYSDFSTDNVFAQAEQSYPKVNKEQEKSPTGPYFALMGGARPAKPVCSETGKNLLQLDSWSLSSTSRANPWSSTINPQVNQLNVSGRPSVKTLTSRSYLRCQIMDINNSPPKGLNLFESTLKTNGHSNIPDLSLPSRPSGAFSNAMQCFPPFPPEGKGGKGAGKSLVGPAKFMVPRILGVTEKRPNSNLILSIMTSFRAPLRGESISASLKSRASLLPLGAHTGLRELTLNPPSRSCQLNTLTSRSAIYRNQGKDVKLKPLRKKTHLIVEIWTNGSLHPRQALYQTFSFLSNTFLKLQTVKIPSNQFKSDFAYGKLKYQLVNNYTTAKTIRNKAVTNTTTYPSSQARQLTPLLRGEIRVNSCKTSPPPHAPTPIRGSEASHHTTNNSSSYNLGDLGILNLSLRVYSLLKKAGILTLNDLLQHTKADLLKIVVYSNVLEIETTLASLGLCLK